MKLSSAERAALREYAAKHGRTWKSKLRHAWEHASEPGILQQLRNASHFGPAGLVKVRPADFASDVWLCVRAGDGDDYKLFDGLDEVADYLREMQAGPIVGWREMGLQTESYRGNNYVSLYWGDEQFQPVCDLDAAERADVEQLLGSNA